MFYQSYFTDVEPHKKSDVYPGHLAMTYGDAENIGRLNARNQWGITYDELRGLGKKHANARKKDDIRTMEKIEYRLDDINFHKESGLLNRGEYDAYMREVEA